MGARGRQTPPTHQRQRAGETVLVHRVVSIPAGMKAAELKLCGRVIGLKSGAQPCPDARHGRLQKRAGVKVKGAKPINFRKDTDGWVDRKVRFAVPEGAVAFDIMPTLFQNYAGPLGVDELRLAVIDPAELNPPAP